MIDLAKCAQFAMDCLDPSQYGYAVTAEVRDAARRALGIAARECPQPSVPKPRPYEQVSPGVYQSTFECPLEGLQHNHPECPLCQRIELERNDK